MRDWLSIISRMRYSFEGGSLGAMLRGSTLDEADQIIGEAAVCSGWTRMEGQGSWNVQQFRLKYRFVYLYVLRCYVKYKDLFWETGGLAAMPHPD